MDAKFLFSGDTAISVEFGNEISFETNQKVTSFNQSMWSNPIEGVTETLPTYRSLMVHYKPEVIRYHKLVEELKARFDQMDKVALPAQKVWEIPLLYGGEFGMDLDEVAKYHNKTPEEIIKIHSSYENLIYMLGFTPGLPYMGAENGLKMPRRSSPRTKIEGDSVVIWENQSIIFPTTAPTGWNVIGITPVKVFDATREDPFLLKAGQWVKFKPVTEEEYYDIKKQVEAGTYQCNVYDKGVR